MSTEHFIIYDMSSGVEIMRGHGPIGTAGIQRPPEGHGTLVIPSQAFHGDLNDHLPEVRAALWEKAKAHRDAAIDGGVATPSGTFDTDRESVTNILGASLAALIGIVGDAVPSVASDPHIATALALLGDAFPIEWTLADNVNADLSKGQTILAGIAAFAHVNAAHAQARATRAAIENAETLQALLQIDVTA